MRKLASIQYILDIQPIEGADKIEVATILGWKVVVKKGEFQVGDLVVYVEVDSILPETEWSEFMRERHFRVKTIKLRKQISQGIAFPLSILGEGKARGFVEEDTDVTDRLGITKYEQDEFNKPTYSTNQKPFWKSSVKKWIPKSVLEFLDKHFPIITRQYFALRLGRSFPNWIPKTDETRVQVLGKLLAEYEGIKFYVTEKLDGSSMTCYLNDGKFGVCSRNVDLTEGAEGSNFWKVARDHNVEARMRNFAEGKVGCNFALQGEMIGEGVQGNKYALVGHDYFIFNVYNIDTQEYLPYPSNKRLVEGLGLKFVPVLEEKYPLVTDIDAIVEKSKGKSVLNPKSLREGIVLRPFSSERNRRDNNVSFKAINPEFLLKHNL